MHFQLQALGGVLLMGMIIGQAAQKKVSSILEQEPRRWFQVLWLMNVQSIFLMDNYISVQDRHQLEFIPLEPACQLLQARQAQL